MEIVNWLRRLYRPKAQTGQAQPREDPLKFLVQKISSVFSPGDHSLQNSEIIFAAVSRISNALSAMPVRLYKGLNPENNALNDLLSAAPNPNMTSCNFFRTMEACRDTSGNAYALKVMDSAMQPVRLDILDPMRVTPYMDTGTKELWYQITDEDKTYWLHNYYVIHLQFVSTSGICGVNPVSVLFGTIDYSQRIKQFALDQLDKGINAQIVLEAPANLGDAQRSAMLTHFVEAYRKTGGNVLLLESGVRASALNLSPVDSRLLEVERITRSKVAMVYNLPPHLLGDYSDTALSTMEQQMLEFLSLTMLPIVRMYEQELDRKLLTPDQRKQGYHWKFDMQAALRADAATMAEVNYKAVRSAWKTPNEIREEYGKPPIKNGDELLISRDMIPLGVTVDRPELLLRGGN